MVHLEKIHDIEAATSRKTNIVIVPGISGDTLTEQTCPHFDSWIREFVAGQKTHTVVWLFHHGIDLQSLDCWDPYCEAGVDLLQTLANIDSVVNCTADDSLVLVGHKLGGFILKKALLHAHRGKHRQREKAVLEALETLIMLGDPHLHTDNCSEWMNLVASCLPKSKPLPPRLCCHRSVQCLQTISDNFEKFTLHSSLFQVSEQVPAKTKPRLRLKRQFKTHGCLCSATIGARMWSSTADEENVPEGKGVSSACAFNSDSPHYRNLILIAGSEYRTMIDQSYSPLGFLTTQEAQLPPSANETQTEAIQPPESHGSSDTRNVESLSFELGFGGEDNALNETDEKQDEIEEEINITQKGMEDSETFERPVTVPLEEAISLAMDESNAEDPSNHIDRIDTGTFTNPDLFSDDDPIEEIKKQDAVGSAKPNSAAETATPRTPFFSTSIPQYDDKFYGREDIFKRLAESLSPESRPADEELRLVRQRRITALHGLAGVGKTACAARWLYKSAACFDAVFWINANNIFHLGRSVHDAAAAIGVVRNRNCHNHTNSRTDFIRCLETTDSNWLLVFDDADDINLLQGWIPRGQFGSILITTRQSASAPFPLDLGNAEHIVVPPFSADQSLSFLKYLVPNPGSSGNLELAESILSIAGRTPSGVRLLAGVLNSRKLSFQSFVDFAKYVRVISGEQHLAPEDVLIPPHSIYSNIWRTQLSSRGLGTVSVLAFLDPYHIHESILLGACAEPNNLSVLGFPTTEQSYWDARAELLGGALCELNTKRNSITCGRTVQRSIRASLSADAFQNAFQAAAVLLLKEWPSQRKLKNIIYGNWPEFDSLHSHLHRLSQIIFEVGYGDNAHGISFLHLASEEFIRLLVFFTWYNASRGNREEDTQLAEPGHALLSMSSLPSAQVETRSNTPPLLSMPSRLIEIDGERCRVVTTTRDEEYVALSHCWDSSKDPKFSGLRKANQTEFQLGISLSCLPSAIQDAVKITSAVGIKYLWVDNCCILQDDDSDKVREVQKMADVFSRSRLTICVDTNLERSITENKHGHPRHFETMCIQVKPYQVYGKRGSGRERPVKNVYIKKLESAVYWSGAWRFQEGILSSRGASPDREPGLAPGTLYTGQQYVLSGEKFTNLLGSFNQDQAIDFHGKTPPIRRNDSPQRVESIVSKNLQNTTENTWLSPCKDEELKEVSETIDKGVLLVEGGNALEAVACFMTAKDSISAFKSSSMQSLELYVLASIYIGLVYWIEDRTTTAFDILDRTLAKFKGHAKEEYNFDLIVGRLYLALGNVCFSLNRLEECFGFYEEAEQIFKKPSDGKSDWLAVLSMRISDYHVSRTQFREARGLLQNAISHFDAQEDSVSTQAQLARLFYRQALLYEGEGNARKKKVAYAAAKEAWLGVREERGLCTLIPEAGLTRKDFDDGVEFWQR